MVGGDTDLLLVVRSEAKERHATLSDMLGKFFVRSDDRVNTNRFVSYLGRWEFGNTGQGFMGVSIGYSQAHGLRCLDRLGAKVSLQCRWLVGYSEIITCEVLRFINVFGYMKNFFVGR